MKALIISKNKVEPTSSAAGWRMLQIIQFLQNSGWQVHYATTAADSSHAFDLTQLNIAETIIKVNDSSFDAFVEQLDPRMVLFDRFMMEEQFGWRVASSCPNALRVLDTEDLHFLRAAREIDVEKGASMEHLNLYNEIAIREIASILRSDLSLIISSYEMDLLTSKFSIASSKLFYLPFTSDPIDTNAWPAFEERADYVSIGSCMHAPNKDSFRYLKRVIWPLIRKRQPRAQVAIYGSYIDQEIMDLNDPENGFLVKGRAVDAKDVLSKSKILLAPLRFGAGLKGKLFEAMQYGTQSITSTIGAEGMADKSGWAGSLEDDPGLFADAAVRLFNDQDAWKLAQGKGLKLLESAFSKDHFEKVFTDRLGVLLDGLESHRSKDFLGKMLNHHRLKSVEYMSRWIEEKNK